MYLGYKLEYVYIALLCAVVRQAVDDHASGKCRDGSPLPFDTLIFVDKKNCVQEESYHLLGDLRD
jgi:hypothetical protein